MASSSTAPQVREVFAESEWAEDEFSSAGMGR
jgi:hypothetical protein